MFERALEIWKSNIEDYGYWKWGKCMKKKLIGISVLVGIIVILFIIFGNQKDILRNILDEDSVIWLGFTQEELDSLMTENNAVFEDGVYKCSFLGYDTKIIINMKQRTNNESYYDISDMVLSIPYNTQEKKAEIIEKLDRYIRAKVGLQSTLP